MSYGLGKVRFDFRSDPMPVFVIGRLGFIFSCGTLKMNVPKASGAEFEFSLALVVAFNVWKTM